MPTAGFFSTSTNGNSNDLFSEVIYEVDEGEEIVIRFATNISTPQT